MLGFGYYVGIQIERSEFERVKRFEARGEFFFLGCDALQQSPSLLKNITR